MRHRLVVATGICLMVPLLSSALAQQVGDVVTFGDSLSESGNIPDLSGGVNFPPSPPYAGNRFSNGPVFSERLPGLLGGRFDPALNFATGGALTGEDNLNSDRSSPLPGSDLSGVTLPGIRTQVDGYIAGGGRLDPGDLVVLYGGANDIFVAAETAASLPADQVPDLVRMTAETAASNLAASVLDLNAVGGDLFVLPNLPDIGSTPGFTEGGPESEALGSAFSRAHNLALGQAAADLQERTGADIVVFDIEGIFADIQANPARYDLTDVTTACIDDLACVTADQAEQNRFLFFDSVHPTTGVHAKVAEILSSTLRAPSTLAAQGDVTLDATADFARMLIESFNPAAATASIALGGSARTPGAKGAASTAGAADTDLFFLADYTDGDRNARAGAAGYDYDFTSLTLGLRHRASDLFSFGTALRIGAGDVDLDSGSESFEHRQADIGITATLGAGGGYLTALGHGGYVDIRDIERRTGIDDVDTEASTDGFTYGAGLAAGYRLALGSHIDVSPIASLRYSAADLEGYVEDGPAFLNQRVDDQDDIERFVASIGAAVTFGLDVGDQDPTDDLKLRLSGYLDHDLDEGDRSVTSAFVTSPTSLTTDIDGGDRTTGRIGADLSLRPIDGFDLGVGYETLIGDGDREVHSIFGRAVVSF